VFALQKLLKEQETYFLSSVFLMVSRNLRPFSVVVWGVSPSSLCTVSLVVLIKSCNLDRLLKVLEKLGGPMRRFNQPWHNHPQKKDDSRRNMLPFLQEAEIITYVGKLSSLCCTVIDIVARTRAATVDFAFRFHLAHLEPGSRTHLGVGEAMRGVCEIVALVQWHWFGRVE
jgi:hypothetical protein